MRLALACALAALASTAQAATVTVQVSGVQAGGGQVYVGLCPTALQESSCTQGDQRAPRGGTMTFAFRGVAAGALAVAVYQDANGNGRLDRNALGVPSEPYGFSNDVGRLAPPTFAGARVEVREPATTIQVRLARFAQ